MRGKTVRIQQQQDWMNLYQVQIYDELGNNVAPNGTVFTTENEWHCLNDISTPVRINKSGDVECMSYNNRDCLWGGGSCQAKVQSAENGPSIRELTCGAMHLSQWGVTGYDVPGLWCNKVRDYWRNLPCCQDASVLAQDRSVAPNLKRHPTLWHSARPFNNFVELRLPSETDIAAIVIYNRTSDECSICTPRIVGAIVSIMNAAGTTVWSQVLTDSRDAYVLLPGNKK